MREAAELKAETVCTTLTGVLARYVGETMARSSVQVNCERLAIGDSASPEQVASLIGRVGAGLKVFVGRERAAQIVAEMKHALSQGGGGQ